ncbi:unnamed protein product, partial [Hapterophycus canaliculatus]
VDAGYASENIFRRSNYILPDLGRVREKQDYGLFVGRLSPEKGINTIASAWNDHNIQTPLRIIGEGPEEKNIAKLTSHMPQVECVGQLPTDQVLEQIANAKFLIISSQWYETFGRTIAEAFSRGTPVIASNLGAMAELVSDNINGLLFEPGDSSSLADAVKRFNGLTPKQCEQIQTSARQSYDERCSPEVSYRELLGIYDSVL